MKAQEVLTKAATLIDARAVERDVLEERSMRRAVGAFNTLTQYEMTETEGWLFMAVLKLSRATTGILQPDDLMDCAAYVALALEAELEKEKCS
jgi:hypothetical protein